MDIYVTNGSAQGYLYAASSSKGNNYLRTKDNVDSRGNSQAVITIAKSSGNATITFQGNYTNNMLLYNKDNTICDSCEDNYDWDSKTKSCVFLCEGETEQYCEECDLNYNSYDYGKTCEKIDPDYVEKDFSKYAKFDFAVLCILLFLVL